MFLFLQYLRPNWYYRLSGQSPANLLSDINKLPSDELNRVQVDLGYNNPVATQMDAAYQALMSGIIPDAETALGQSEIITVQSTGANYRFIRKFYATHWYVYTYILRLLTLNNPIRETWYFVKNFSVNRVNLTKFSQYTKPEPQPLKSYPLVSVIIPTLNRYPYLKDVLSDLEAQDYSNFEVLVCDQSEPVDEVFYQGWNLDLTLIKQTEKALWLARNTCIQMAKGSYILLFDDDSRVEPDWIRCHLECLEKFNTQISAGVTHTLVGHGLSPKESFYHLSDVFDTGNAMIKREVFEKVGLFDRQFEKQRMGDGEFGIRAIINGYQIISNPHARREHLKVESGGLRQMGSWDGFRPKSWFAPRPVPSVLYLTRKYFGTRSAIYLLIQNIFPSLVPYQYKKSRLMKMLALLASLVLWPLVLYQVLLSWNQSSKKLKKGALIPLLEPVH